ncbi:bifunctional copper resistance protein CopD/cytochrome c oxidase assembly protein [Georgenia sp. SYP-B2076]|uniref:bifunctional copper resistance protein CopD/cytochrome c oxidase assembly protein n=1 Tax=Georgenia sp. SYP-B2076 TaxID=2495881 RepID=UPI001F0CC65D|nr:bifunctional copper resistance protein CopD/cytochrome c oxidase assembly protein [Georgenia sp. SYP-B2076]
MVDSSSVRRQRLWWYAAGSLPLALLAMIAGLALTGAAAPSVLVDPGALVRWGLPVATLLTHAAGTLTVGAFALCALVLPAPARASHRTAAATARAARATAVDGAAWTLAARAGAVAAVVWALAQLAHVVLTHSSIVGTGIGGPGYGSQLAQFVTEIELGRDLMWATVLTALVAVVAVSVGGYASAAWVAALALAALFPTALTGHAAGAASHELAVSSWWLHVGAVTVWVGGLAVLCLVASRTGRDLPDAVQRYSHLALWCFVIVALSGSANAWIRLNSPAELVTHPYGQLLLIKLVLTVALGLAGWEHRRATIPAIRAHPGPSAGRAFWRLAGVEVLVMGAVVGVAVALGSSAPPVPQAPVPDAGPVYLLTGHPVPPYPTALTYLTQWRLDPLFALVGAAALVVYVGWALRLRRRGDAWSPARTAAWVAGVLLFTWVTNGGPAVYGKVLFSAHMIQHMLLVMVVPVFLVLGAPVTLAMRALPHRLDGSRGPREWLLVLVHSRVASFFSNPIVAALNFAGSLIVFYYSPLFEGALTTHLGHVLMVVHFTLAGYLFANVMIGIDPGPSRPPYPLRLLLLFATMAFHAFFGISVISMTSLLAADYFGRLGLPWWVDAMADQEKGGAITWGIGEIPTLALAIGVAVAWSTADDRTARRSDRKADRDEDAELRAYNDMLAARARQSDEELRHQR